VYAPPADAQWAEAWSITADVLDLFHREAREHDAKFLAVAINAPEQVPPDPAVSRHIADRLGVANLDYPDTRLTEIAAHSGFPLVSLTEPMRTSAERDRVYYHGFPNTALGTGHWNEAGHKIAGELLAAYLCEHPEFFQRDGD
jgi:hypothetical protein